MTRLLSVPLALIGLLVLAAAPAFALDAQPGGRGDATVTVGAATVDQNDMVIERCECDGGPLQSIVAQTRRVVAGRWSGLTGSPRS